MQLAHRAAQPVEAIVDHARGVAAVPSDVAPVVAVDDETALPGTGAASRMPDGSALKVHLLPVAKGVATLGAARAGRVEVVVVARL